MKVWKGREKIQKFEYFENEKSFLDETKTFFPSFRRCHLKLSFGKKVKKRAQAIIKALGLQLFFRKPPGYDFGAVENYFIFSKKVTGLAFFCNILKT